MDEKLKTIRRVLVKGLLTGGIYVLLWILVVRGYYVWMFSESAIITIIFIGAVPVYYLLSHGGTKGWGWSYAIAVLLSFFCNFQITFDPVVAQLCSGTRGPGMVFVLIISPFMAASKGLTLFLMVVTVI